MSDSPVWNPNPHVKKRDAQIADLQREVEELRADARVLAKAQKERHKNRSEFTPRWSCDCPSCEAARRVINGG